MNHSSWKDNELQINFFMANGEYLNVMTEMQENQALTRCNVYDSYFELLGLLDISLPN